MTSRAAPAIQPSVSARSSAASSTSAPREVLMRYAVGFIARNSSSPMRPWVSGEAGAWSDT